MEEFIESQGYTIGGVYKINTATLEVILEKYKTEVLSDLAMKYPSDADLGASIRKGGITYSSLKMFSGMLDKIFKAVDPTQARIIDAYKKSLNIKK